MLLLPLINDQLPRYKPIAAMVTVVVVINFLLALILFYAAWQVWQLRKLLARITNTLIAVEQSSHTVLKGAPKAIYTGKQGIHQLRQGREPLQLKLQRVRQVLTLFGLGQQVWRQFWRRFLLKQPKLK